MILASPAAGYITDIATMDVSAMPGLNTLGEMGVMTRIAIFLPPWGDHNQYAPLPGRVTAIEYIRGSFHYAGIVRKSNNNERQHIVITSRVGDVMVTQIAGVLARRIHAAVSLTERVKQFQKIGNIDFGSRVDLYVPKPCEVFVNKADHIAAKAPIAECLFFHKKIH